MGLLIVGPDELFELFALGNSALVGSGVVVFGDLIITFSLKTQKMILIDQSHHIYRSISGTATTLMLDLKI